ncbi:Branched-chain amino acid transport system / permease component [Candidatus Arcanobacter lacustris]|jgi:putative ABC transport system permease protein|uniref:Branched-chain amino acid transport system / permease component n=1 Tax=Candidatus Arcanibacter lacustris TaxID=1607817 RepID=A0A0F5MNG8_9RICK|nr:Branched-chain amino acid transport system / permease component [Candidatus Arcanobacter lacustris]
MNFMQLVNGLELGALYSLVAIAVYISFRVINFADLTVDGSFPLGGAVLSILVINDVNYIIALLASVASGMVAGFVTAYLNVRHKIFDILAGILTMTALYSINLRIMGRPNIALMDDILPADVSLLIVPVIALSVAILVILFLKTQIGLALISVGQNPVLAESCGIDTSGMKILALAISNGLVALAGGLFVLKQGFADISIGTGTIIIGLASVIIGTKLLSSKSISLTIIGIFIGSIIYRLFVALALNIDFIGLEPSDLNLISSLLVAFTMIFPTLSRLRK